MKEIKNLYIADVNTWENDSTMGIRFDWEANIGFGQLELYTTGVNWKADTECMCKGEDKDFIRMILEKWVDEIEVEE